MAAVVMVTGKRVGGLSYALQSFEWPEFNMVEKTSSCVLTGNNEPSLLLFLTLSTAPTLSPRDFNHSYSVNVAATFIVLIASL